MRKRTSRKSQAKAGNAIVIGGSASGMLAARVLSDHYERVTIVEHDPFPDGDGASRKGVPQARHLHVLLMRGRLILEHFFPGITEQLVRDGAILLDVTKDLAWLTPAGWAVRFPSDLAILGCSRDVMDWVLLKRLGIHGEVRFLEKHLACGLLGDTRRVTGVKIRPLGRDVEHWKADLVVDASGRASRIPDWLAELGVPRPKETVVDAYLGYSSRLFERTSPYLREDWRALYLQPAPPDRPRGGAIFPIENNRWIVTLIGGNKDYPPHNEQGFLEFAERVGDPVFLSVLKDLKPVSPISTYRATGNRMRHYESVKPWPEGMAVLGDAACAFNPVYAQGVTMAALGAQTLSDWLKAPGKIGFQEALAEVNEIPWLLATSEDFRYERTRGLAPAQATRLLHGYVDSVVALSTREIKVRRRFAEVLHLLKPVTSLFEPGILFKVLMKRARRAS